MQYKVINAGHLRTLESIVNLNMRDGWVPTGGVYAVPKDREREHIWSISSDGEGTEPVGDAIETELNWCQAVIRRAPL